MTDTAKQKPLMTIGRAIDRLAKLRTARHVDSDTAVRKVHERYNTKEAALLAEVEPEMRDRVLHLLDVETPSVVAFAKRMNEHVVTHSEVVDHSDDTPSRPELPEYGARGVMEPLPPERAAIAKGRR
jgi:uncharacterized protein YcbK (DUF882 family)